MGEMEGRLGKAEECEVNTCQKRAPCSSLLSGPSEELVPWPLLRAPWRFFFFFHWPGAMWPLTCSVFVPVSCVYSPGASELAALFITYFPTRG